MAKLTRKTLLDVAGRLHALRSDLKAARRQQVDIAEHIAVLERKAAAAEQEYNLLYERLLATGPRAADAARSPDTGDLAKDKLPYRVLREIQPDPTRTYTAPELAAKLKVADVQKVRTALARLVDKGYVRRAGAKGQYTI
jgi:hypothetical protein